MDNEDGVWLGQGVGRGAELWGWGLLLSGTPRPGTIVISVGADYLGPSWSLQGCVYSPVTVWVCHCQYVCSPGLSVIICASLHMPMAPVLVRVCVSRGGV